MTKRKPIIIPYVVEKNIEVIEDILKHPELWGSGTKEDWVRHLEEQKKLLKEAKPT